MKYLLLITALMFTTCQTQPAQQTRLAERISNIKSVSVDIADEQTEGYVCLGKTKKGERCKRKLSEAYYKTNGAYCWQHKDQKEAK